MPDITEAEHLMKSFAEQAVEEEYLALKANDGREAHQHSVNASRLLRQAAKNRLEMDAQAAAA